MEALITLDHHLFEWINQGWQHPWLDAILPHWREKTTWVPAYILLVAMLAWKYRSQAIYWLLALAIVVGTADQISSSLLKKNVQRLRPCWEAALDPPARVLVHCGGGYSFTSSHATNHFAVALFIFLTWGRRWGYWRWGLLFWAATIALGQVYVGVHYPLDIFVGGMIGSLLGAVGSFLYTKSKFRIPAFYTTIPPV